MSESALSASSQYSSALASMQKELQPNGNNDLANQLFRQYGVQNVLNSVNNAAAEYLTESLLALIDTMAMPQFMKDDAKKQVSSVGDSYTSDTPRGAQEGVDKVLGQSSGESGGSSNAGKDVMSGTMDMIKKSMQDSTESASSKNGSTGGSGNWLAILAKALGQTAGKSLKNMVELGKKMGGMDSKENPEAFAETQAEFQAQAQIFKMFQEAIGTMIKSIGEGMSSVARKQ